MNREKTYEIDLSGAAGGVDEYDWHIDKSFFEDRENSDILGSDVDVALDVTKRNGSYELDFHFEGELQVPCDRCLAPMAVNVDEDYHVIVRHGEEYDDSQDELLVIPESWTHLDVAPLIYDSLMLAIPLRCVHAEGECDSTMSEILSRHDNGEPQE